LSAMLVARLEAGDRSDGLLTSAARVAICLDVAGRHSSAQALLARLFAMGSEASCSAIAWGWFLRARAMRALQSGDASLHLRLEEEAANAFERVGAARITCSARVNAGFARLELGLHAEAEAALREALRVAERLGLLHIAASARWNLACVLGRRGALAE